MEQLDKAMHVALEENLLGIGQLFTLLAVIKAEKRPITICTNGIFGKHGRSPKNNFELAMKALCLECF